MKILLRVSLLLLATIMTSCEVIGNIFGAGVYTGVFIVVFLIGLIAILIAKSTRRK